MCTVYSPITHVIKMWICTTTTDVSANNCCIVWCPGLLMCDFRNENEMNTENSPQIHRRVSKHPVITLSCFFCLLFFHICWFVNFYRKKDAHKPYKQALIKQQELDLYFKTHQENNELQSVSCVTTSNVQAKTFWHKLQPKFRLFIV